MSNQLQHLKAVIFDWAGTMIDFGSCAPAAVFQRVFHERGIAITADQARETMGMAKREHIAAIAECLPFARLGWQSKARDFAEPDIDEISPVLAITEAKFCKSTHSLSPALTKRLDNVARWG